MSGTKNDQAKPDLSLIPTDALWGMAAALTYGAKKYDRHNFREGIEFSRLVAACMRHLTAWNEGENIDNETSLSHLDHALASLAMLKFMEVNRQDMDNRYIVEKNPDLEFYLKNSTCEVTDAEEEEMLLRFAEAMQERGR